MGLDKTYIGERTSLGLRVLVDNGHVRALLEHYVRHSPTGFECGYNGSGPADLARCILIDHFDLHLLAQRESVVPGVERRYQAFKSEVIAELQRQGTGELWQLTSSQIGAWLRGADWRSA